MPVPSGSVDLAAALVFGFFAGIAFSLGSGFRFFVAGSAKKHTHLININQTSVNSLPATAGFGTET